jgi:hypothetical protein
MKMLAINPAKRVPLHILLATDPWVNLKPPCSLTMFEYQFQMATLYTYLTSPEEPSFDDVSGEFEYGLQSSFFYGVKKCGVQEEACDANERTSDTPYKAGPSSPSKAAERTNSI